MQFSFVSYSPKIFRLVDLNINSKWKYNIRFIWIQFLIQGMSVLGILYVCKT